MKKVRVKTVAALDFHVSVTLRDIEDGQCMVPGKCMHKIAIERALRKIDPNGGDHHVRVDSGAIKFNYDGWRMLAATPRIAKKNLIQFDKEVHIRKRAKAKDEPFVSKVTPHQYDVSAQRTTKIVPQTVQDAARSRALRAVRKAEGRPYKRTQAYHRLRVIGGSATV